ncbi:hypothetical protein [Nocardioides sp. GY 10127]|uniref:hypothetical protein n=1 Tax=Nocardioides sp. GY 10127 TaxID=2569762 RepID=UPI0010A83A0D|nr:hypothetical protein [Nocardioides sp. GY 10127]TIC86414.1 hypothetical protein E8D37_00425 [Nocardioides sp. GY 10127]
MTSHRTGTRRARAVLPAVTVLALVGLGLVGCGSDDSDSAASADSSSAAASTDDSASASDSAAGSASGSGDYCADLASTQDDLSALDSDDPTSLEKAFDAFDVLAAEAPDDVADDWAVLAGVADNVRNALEQTGLTLSDLSELSSTGELPDGVTQAQVLAVANELTKMSSTKTSKAAQAIAAAAQSDCGITLGAAG